MSQILGQDSLGALSLSLQSHNVIESIVQISNFDPRLGFLVTNWPRHIIINEFEIGCLEIDDVLLRLILVDRRDYYV
jgi:hypothetical protein